MFYCCQIELLCFDICDMDERRERLSFLGAGDDVTRMTMQYGVVGVEYVISLKQRKLGPIAAIWSSRV